MVYIACASCKTKMPLFNKNIKSFMVYPIVRIFLILFAAVGIASCAKHEQIRPIQLPPTSVLNVQTTWAVINAPHLRLREQPDESSQVVRYLKGGFVLEIISKTGTPEILEGEKDYWYQITFDGLNGWVFGAYLDLYDSREQAEAASRELD